MRVWGVVGVVHGAKRGWLREEGGKRIVTETITIMSLKCQLITIIRRWACIKLCTICQLPESHMSIPSGCSTSDTAGPKVASNLSGALRLRRL